MSYVAPQVKDYGTLVEVTEATFVVGAEDGASKLDSNQHHSLGLVP